MHGVSRAQGEDPAVVEKQRQKIQAYRKLLLVAMAKKKERQFDGEALKLTGELLVHNGECYSMWNFRRLTLLHMFGVAEAEAKESHGEGEANADPQARVLKLLHRELEFSKTAISKGPKSYWCWNHRQWATTELHKRNACDWAVEVKLCDLFLKYDSRNFHCWNYRRYATAHGKVADRQELEFTMSKIEENFSNYSAWHQRSTLLPRIFTEREEFLAAVDKEFEYVQNAFYTEPKDQSAWLYHRWLVSRNPSAEVLERELAMCEELLGELEEDEKKWPKLTTVLLLQQLGRDEERVRGLLEDLRKIDPCRTKYYGMLLAKYA